jgi:hypothetical protein
MDYNNFRMRHLECQTNANFPYSVTIIDSSINFCIVVSILKEAINMKRSVAFQCVTVEGREKLLIRRPLVSDSSSKVSVELNCHI